MAGEVQKEKLAAEIPSAVVVDKRIVVLRAAAMGTVLLAGPAIGTIIGFKVGSHGEHSSNVKDRAAAQKLEHCIPELEDFTRTGKLVVKASQIPDALRQDCELDGLITDAKSIYTDGMKKYDLAGNAGKVTGGDVDPEIQLSTPQAAAVRVANLKHRAETTGMGGPIEAGAAGFFAGFMVESMAIVGAGYLADRRNHGYKSAPGV